MGDFFDSVLNLNGYICLIIILLLALVTGLVCYYKAMSLDKEKSRK